MTTQNFCQTTYGVWGEKLPSKIHIFLYTEIDSSRCSFNLNSAIPIDDKQLFIIDESIFVIGFCRVKSYLVVYKGKKYFVKNQDVLNERDIDSSLQKIKERVPDQNLRFAKYDEELQKLVRQAEEEKRQAEEEKRQAEEEKLRQAELEQKELRESLDKLEAEFKKMIIDYRTKNIVISDWSWGYDNEYSSFLDLDISIINPYKLKIKYVWITFQTFNAVDDPAKDQITGKSEKTVKGIGPINPNEIGSYQFESVFYSKVVNTIKIKQIKIQFFDNTIKIINNPKVASK